MCICNIHTESSMPCGESWRLKRLSAGFARMRKSDFLDVRGNLQTKTLVLWYITHCNHGQGSSNILFPDGSSIVCFLIHAWLYYLQGPEMAQPQQSHTWESKWHRSVLIPTLPVWSLESILSKHFLCQGTRFNVQNLGSWQGLRQAVQCWRARSNLYRAMCLFN